MSCSLPSDGVLLFLHIPKTAGTTLTNILYAEYKARGFSPGEGRLGSRFDLSHDILYVKENSSAGFHRDVYAPSFGGADLLVLRRPDVRAIVGHFTFGVHEWLERPAAYITLLRNPIDRVVSLYHHMRAHPDDYPENAQAARGTIVEFVERLRRMQADNDQVRRLVGVDVPFGECTPEMVDQAIENLSRHFVAVGMTERFDESVVLFARTLGWCVPSYDSWFVNPARPTRSALERAELEAIVRMNSLDLALYEHVRRRFDRTVANAGPTFSREVEALRAASRAPQAIHM